MLDIRVKRVYEPASSEDGTRVLVDRLWPRGLTAEKVAALWLKEAAPSNALRQMFHHDVERWDDFRAAYFAELDAKRSSRILSLLMDQGLGQTILAVPRETDIPSP